MRSKTTPSEIVFHLRSSEQFLQCYSIHSNTIKDSLQCAGYIHGRWNPAWDPCWVGSHIAGLERPTPWYNSCITMLAVAAVAHGISQDAAENIAKMWQHPPAAQTSHLWWAARPMRSWSSWCLPVVLILHLKSQNVTKPVPDSFPVRCQNCSFCTTRSVKYAGERRTLPFWWDVLQEPNATRQSVLSELLRHNKGSFPLALLKHMTGKLWHRLAVCKRLHKSCHWVRIYWEPQNRDYSKFDLYIKDPPFKGGGGGG